MTFNSGVVEEAPVTSRRRATLSQSQLQGLMVYSPETGIAVWSNPNRAHLRGLRVGYLDSEGYRRVKIKGRVYRFSRLVVLYMTGEDTRLVVDHINRVRDDDRWENLRCVGISANNRNRLSKGYTKDYNKFKAEIRINGRKRVLGRFDTSHEAHAAYVRAKTAAG